MVCAVKGFNPTGALLHVQEILLPKPSPRIGAPQEVPLAVMAASGPFSFTSDLDFSPLGDLLAEVVERSPHYLILCGPFVDCDNAAPIDKV